MWCFCQTFAWNVEFLSELCLLQRILRSLKLVKERFKHKICLEEKDREPAILVVSRRELKS